MQCFPTLLAAAAMGLATTPRILPPEIIAADGNIRYFAFGSNLLSSKMAGRGDTQVVSREAAVVPDHRLSFNMRMFPPLEPAMASIDPSCGDTCEGVLYTVTPDGYEALWRSEGGAMARPGYEEVVVSAVVGGEPVQAITLRAAPWMRLRRDAPPSARYKQLIVDGAKEIGLSDSYVARLSALPAASPSAALTAIARAHGVVALLLFKLGLRKALVPLRAACYALLRGQSAATQSATLTSQVMDLTAEIATAALLLPTAALGATLRLVLKLCGKEKWVQFGPPPSKRASTETPSSNAATSRSGVQGARMSTGDEPPNRLKDLSELRDLAELKSLRDMPPGLLPSPTEGRVLTRPQQPSAAVRASTWREEEARSPPRATNRELNSRKLGRRGARRRGGDDAVRDAVVRWAEVDEGGAPPTAGHHDGVNQEEADERKAVEAMLSRRIEADELAGAPTDLLDEMTRTLQAAEAAEAEAAAAAARAAELRAAAAKSVEIVRAAAAREQMSHAIAARVGREEAEEREEAALRAAMGRALGGAE